jgi:Na+/melibiose symporter-like transporter
MPPAGILENDEITRVHPVMQAATQQETYAPVPRLNWWVTVLYGAGEIANSIKVISFALYSMFYVTVVMGLPGLWVGFLGFATVLWDALIDPFLGVLIDHAGAQVRRYFFMLTGALTMGVGYWAFFAAPRGLSMAPLFAWLLIATLLVRTASSMYMVPYYAIGANLSQDYHERTSVTAIRGIMSTIGTALAAAVSFVVFFPEKAPGVDPKLDPAGYASMGLTFGAVMTLVALVSTFSTVRMQNVLTGSTETRRRPQRAFFKSVRESLRNPTFRLLLVSCGFVVIGLTLNHALLLHFLTYYVEIKGSAALSTAQVAFFGGGLLGTFFWLRASKKIDKHLLYLSSAVVTSALLLSVRPLFGNGHLFGTGDIRPLLAAYSFAGFFACIFGFLPSSMLADVIDESELTTGHRGDGALFGIFSLGQQAAVGVGVMLAGVLLDQGAGFVPGQAQQSASTASRIGVIYSAVPAAWLIVAAVLMSRYKLSRSRLEYIQAELKRRRGSEAVAATAVSA